MVAEMIVMIDASLTLLSHATQALADPEKV